ncbi:MAG: VWA domain-containing protein [Bryobacterales bacterium]|nr:VWA domain-containing protein [Bryobacterales bacterium]
MAIVITAIMLVFVIPVVGLAIDAAVLYTIKARLQTAVDAGAVAAARTLNKGLTLAEQAGNAQAKATAYFYANFQEGDLGAKNVTVPTPDVSESGFRRRTVTVVGQAMAPTYFMRVFGYTFTPVRATGTATRRDVNIIMVMDRSGSMASSGSCEPMKDAAKDFVSLFANGRDRIGIITYSTSYYNAFPHTMDFMSTSPNINTVINNVTCTGGTNSPTAISQAYNDIVGIDEPGVMNIILFFTDGLPSAATASWPVKKKEDTRYGYGPNSSSIAAPVGTYRSTTNTALNSKEQFPSNSTQYSYVPPSPCRHTVGGTYYTWYQTNGGGTKYLQSTPNPSWNPPDKTGVIVYAGNGQPTGGTIGLYNALAPSLAAAQGAVITDSTGCRFASSTNYIRRDIAYAPNSDVYGNAFRGSMMAVDEYGSGNYSGQIRVDTPQSLMKAYKNATYNASVRIRGDSRIQPVFYNIALGNPAASDPLDVPDTDLLLRMSNDPSSPEYTDTQPSGMFVFAPDNTQLNAAFVRVASEILRIAN